MQKYKIRIKPEDGIFRKMGIRNIIVSEIVFSEKNKKIKFICEVPTINNLNEIDLINDSIKRKFGKELDVDFQIEFQDKNMTKENLISIVDKAIEILKTKNAISRSFLYLYRIHIDW